MTLTWETLIAVVTVVLVAWPLVSWLIDWMRKEQAERTMMVTHGLAKAAGWLSYEEALQLLEDGRGNRGQTIQAVKILGDMPSAQHRARVISVLIDQFRDDDPGVRTMAAVSLGKIGDASALPALVAASASRPGQHELELEQSAQFEKKFLEARARREGVTMTKLRVRDPQAEHTELREAAQWAIQQINRRR